LGLNKTNKHAESAYLALCNKLKAEPAKKDRTYWFIDIPMSELGSVVAGGEAGYPDEVGQFVEGATKQVIVNAYERDPKARAFCLSHHGYDCSVCGFNFGHTFGKLGDKFIHVHHLTAISATGVAHAVDPINDLRPVCPNCHAMFHKSDPPFSINEMKELLVKR
jgi:5-methylcytosine-specific restriction protein A